jgi:hypothetical protein
LIAVFFLPSSFQVFWPAILILLKSSAFIPFFLGILTFLIVNKFLRKTAIWTWLWVLEHETVHLLVGLLCFKIPKRWRVTSNGGHVGFDRGGNWLITISPYIFPLLPLLTFICVQLLSLYLPVRTWVLPASMGFAVSAHTAFTWMESDRRQPDVQRIGGLFALLVAPTVHFVFLCVILVLTASSQGSPVQPVAKVLQEIAYNGPNAWRIFALRSSEIVFADPIASEPSSSIPANESKSKGYSMDKNTPASNRLYFERKSKKNNTETVRVGN